MITYNIAAILDAATGVGNNAAGMADDYQDVHNRTSALLGHFSGGNAASFAYHQSQFLEGFQHLIETTTQFSHTVKTVCQSTVNTDETLARMPGF
jgi:uncharacterized protein YukE